MRGRACGPDEAMIHLRNDIETTKASDEDHRNSIPFRRSVAPDDSSLPIGR